MISRPPPIIFREGKNCILHEISLLWYIKKKKKNLSKVLYFNWLASHNIFNEDREVTPRLLLQPNITQISTPILIWATPRAKMAHHHSCIMNKLVGHKCKIVK